jgi:hypothetical protein
MARAVAPSAPPALPWWTSDGDSTCGFCLQVYHYELAYRCPDCDRPVCPSCAVRVSVEVLEAASCPDCPGCADDMDGDDMGKGG